jgi:hypothetical protein
VDLGNLHIEKLYFYMNVKILNFSEGGQFAPFADDIDYGDYIAGKKFRSTYEIKEKFLYIFETIFSATSICPTCSLGRSEF